MYIRRIEKKNKNSTKTYLYYRLVHGYKVGDKVRQQTLLNLRKLEDCPVEKHKALADRIEMLLTGSESIFNDIDESIEALAQRFAKEIQSKRLFPSLKRKTAIGKAPDKTFEEVNLESIEEEESKTIGGEWLCKQAFDRLGIDTLLSRIGMNETQISMAQMLLTAKLIHPSVSWKQKGGCRKTPEPWSYMVRRRSQLLDTDCIRQLSYFMNKRSSSKKNFTACAPTFSASVIKLLFMT